jgi:hypothetical protein
MKPNPKLTAATLVVLAAATVSTMHALAIAPVPMVLESDGPARMAPRPMTNGRPH